VKGYARFKLKGESYPGLIPSKGAATEGVLYLGVDALSMNRLDDFEGELYERSQISAVALDGESLVAHAYVIKAECRDLLSSAPWDPDRFEAEDLREFMAGYQGFHRTDPTDPSI
jgi:gamma-glutamylcyclotransferase (GGCT)/AIG2-like uncharacterized protein YtfP